MIFSNSRYIHALPYRILNKRGEYGTALYRRHPRHAWNFTYTEYLVKNYDRLDLLAFRFYGDSTKWWLLAEANPELLFDPSSELPIGSVLRIPDADSVLEP